MSEASRVSPKLGELLTCKKLVDLHATFLLKYPHNIYETALFSVSA